MPRRFLGSPAGCGLSYGARHSHISAASSRTMSNAQRAEIARRDAMGIVVFVRVNLTDSQQTKVGLGTLSREAIRRKRYKDLWRRIEAALEAKGTEC